MKDEERLTSDILIDQKVYQHAEQEFVDALSLFGVTSTVRVVDIRRGISELQWLALVSLPLQAFFAAICNKMAEDAYVRLKAGIRTLLGKSGNSASDRAIMMLQDPISGMRIYLDADLSDEAYQSLFELDLTRFDRGLLRYDLRSRQWSGDRVGQDGS